MNAAGAALLAWQSGVTLASQLEHDPAFAWGLVSAPLVSAFVELGRDEYIRWAQQGFVDGQAVRQ